MLRKSLLAKGDVGELTMLLACQLSTLRMQNLQNLNINCIKLSLTQQHPKPQVLQKVTPATPALNPKPGKTLNRQAVIAKPR